jgi:hypothetical protein
MPPETAPVEHPKTSRKKAARDWLEAHGIIPVVPSIRSSDGGKDEYMFYLGRILGLVPAFSYSTALSLGTWFHKRAELMDQPPEIVDREFEDFLGGRYDEIKELGINYGMGKDAMQPFLDQEYKDAMTARATFEIGMTLPISSDISSLNDYLRRPEFPCLGTELVIPDEYSPRDNQAKVQAPIQIDRLHYHEPTKTIWITDFKTTAVVASVRAGTCSLDFQTWRYMFRMKKMIDSGEIRVWFPELPADVTLGGFMHFIIQKPTISFGQNDRLYCYISEGKRSGKSGEASLYEHGGWRMLEDDTNKYDCFHTEEEAVAALHEYTGKKPEKVYEGEPDFDLFLQRVGRWYNAEGEYLDKKPDREANPPVVISRINALPFFLQEDVEEEYTREMNRLYYLCTREPEPFNFSRLANKGLLSYGRLNPYAPFYVSPPANWPEIVAREQFTILHRDEVPNSGK